ncbi:MAG: hypothetical protein JW947_11445 [Sedimentisphaerales bacterium]|nr:hypothetical protein [Sedimentisphaerales bacterium]
MGNRRWLINISLFLWLVSFTVYPAFAQREALVKQLLQDAAGWRGEQYRRARDILVQQGESILPLLELKIKSTDLQEQLFAKILMSRIKEPEKIETWHKDLMSLVSDDKVLKEARTYQEMDWGELPQQVADVPSHYLVDVIWQIKREGSSNDREITAVAIQFYLKPDIDAVDAVIEAVLRDHALERLAKKAIVKIGNPAAPQMREVLTKTIEMQTSLPWDSRDLTTEQRQAWREYEQQIRRALVAADVLSHLDDRQSIPLIAKCLTGPITYYQYIEGLSNSLAGMKAVEAINSMLDCTLKSAVKRWYKGENQQPGYVVLRSDIKSLGKQALPQLQERLNSAENEAEKIVLTNLIAELSGIKGKEKEIAELRESIWFNPTAEDLLKLRKLTKEDIFPQLIELVLGKRQRVYGITQNENERTLACLALGTIKDERAVTILIEDIRKQHELLEKVLNKRKTKEGAEPFDPQKLREAGYTFDDQENVPQSLAWGDTCLLALRRIGGDKAKQAIASISYPEYEARVKVSLLLMEGRLDDIIKYLRGESKSFREEAALALLERRDKRATRELLCAAARRHGPSHNLWKEYALSSRKDILPVLRELAKSENVREQVLGSAMIIEIESPEKEKECDKLLQDAATHISMMHVIRADMIEGSGREIAKKLDDNYVPLLEAKCLFGKGIIRRGIAAYSLAEFKKPRSMYVLAESLNMGSLDGYNPAALALADYGQEGVELAAKIPAPIEGEYDTGLQMTMHRGGVRVFAEKQDVRGVDEILKGLEVLSKDDTLEERSYRMRIYLDAAGKFHDKRLVEPLLSILAKSEWPEQVIQLLSAYEDQRITPLFTQFLESFNPIEPYNNDSLYNVTLAGLARQLGENIAEYLIRQYNESESDKIRAGALLGLGKLCYPQYYYFSGEQWAERSKIKINVGKAAEKVRKLAYPVLAEATKAPSSDINYIAAFSLTILAAGNVYDKIAPDLRAVSPLNDWCRAQNKCFFPLTEYLRDHGNMESGKVLLDVMKSQSPLNYDCHVVEALKKLKPDGVVPVFVRNIGAKTGDYKQSKSYYDNCELDALAKFGKEGEDALLEILKSNSNLMYRIQSARLLGEINSRDGTELTTNLLLKVVETGPNNQELVSRSSESQEEAYIRCCGILFEALFKMDPDAAKIQAEDILLNGPEELKNIALKIWQG